MSISNESEKEFMLSKQLVRSGANIAEANGAISKADFSNKILEQLIIVN